MAGAKAWGAGGVGWVKLRKRSGEGPLLRTGLDPRPRHQAGGEAERRGRWMHAHQPHAEQPDGRVQRMPYATLQTVGHRCVGGGWPDTGSPLVPERVPCVQMHGGTQQR